MLYQLTYISSVSPGVPLGDCEAILAKSRFNNLLAGVTGLLMCDGTRFLQALEGERSAVETTYERIKADPRHRSVVILSDREVGNREFGNWAMAFERGSSSDGSESLADAVDRLTADLPSKNVQALFRSFARVDRFAEA